MVKVQGRSGDSPWLLVSSGASRGPGGRRAFFAEGVDYRGVDIPQLLIDIEVSTQGLHLFRTTGKAHRPRLVSQHTLLTPSSTA